MADTLATLLFRIVGSLSLQTLEILRGHIAGDVLIFA
jgi:hypothetical protein